MLLSAGPKGCAV